MAALGGAGGPSTAPSSSSSAAPAGGPVVHDVKMEHETVLMLRTRVLLAGDAAVGKTALAKMFASGSTDYPRNYVMTTGIELSSRAIKAPSLDASADEVASPGALVRTATHVEFQIIDTPGSTIFNQREAGMKIWGLANYLAVVFDIGSKASFASVTKWARRAQDARAASDSPALAGKAIAGVLIGAKADFRDDSAGLARAEVAKEDAAALAASLGLAYFEVSSETGTGVDAPFQHLARLVRKGYETEISHAQELASR